MNQVKQPYPLQILLILLGFMFLLGCEKFPPQNENNQLSDKTIEVINIGRLICGGHLPLAIVEKLYQDQFSNFSIHTVQNNDWNDVVFDMKSGKLAGTFILSPLAMNLIREGFPGKIVFMSDRNGNGFILSKSMTNIDALKTQKSIIAVPHLFSQQHVLVNKIMTQHHIPTENVVILPMPPRDMINSLKRGEIDGFMVGEPEGNKAINLGIGWMAAKSPDIWSAHMDHVFLVSNAFIKQQPEKLQQLINQLVRGSVFIEQHPKEAAKLGESYTGSSADVFEQVLTSPPNWITFNDSVIKEQELTSMAIQLVEMGLWKAMPKDLNSHYIDNRFAMKAEKQFRE